jgi:two-component system, LytTR family, response regulator
MTSQAQSFRFRNYYLPPVAVGFILLCVAIGKDMIHANIHHYHFYISESALFETVWPIFVPLLVWSLRLRKIRNKLNPVFFALLLTVIHITFFSAFVYTISALFFDHTFNFSGLLFKTTAESGISCLLVFFVASVFSRHNKLAEAVKVPAKIVVKQGDKAMLIDVENIIYIKSQTPYIALVTSTGTFLYNSTLKAFMQEKATRHFIRIHKSAIVNMAYVKSCRSRKNGDYDATLTNGKILRVSRRYSNYFKSYFR